MVKSTILSLKRRAEAFEREAHAILAIHEGAKSRIFTVRETRARLKGLSLQQEELFDHALSCIEHGMFRAAYVMSWSGFIDFLEQKLSSDNFVKIHARYSNWKNIKSVEQLREGPSEYAIVEAAKEVGFLKKQELRILHGRLEERHKCAHPSDFSPNFTGTLGFINDLLEMTEILLNRPY